MNETVKAFFEVVKALSEAGIIHSRDYLDNVLRSLVKDFIPEQEVFFSSNCPEGRPVMVPFAAEDPVYLVLGANYPVGMSSEVLIYKVQKERLRSLLREDHYVVSKEVLLRLEPMARIDLDRL